MFRVSYPYSIERQMREKQWFVEHQVLHKQFSTLYKYPLQLLLHLYKRYSGEPATGREEMSQMILVYITFTVFNNLKIINSIFWYPKYCVLYCTEGIQLTGYHRLGTIHITRPVHRHNNDDLSDVANAIHIGTESIRKLVAPKESTLR